MAVLATAGPRRQASRRTCVAVFFVLVGSLSACSISAAPGSSEPIRQAPATLQISPSDAPRQIVIEGSFDELNEGDLAEAAEAVAVLRIAESGAPRWNSEANKPWVSDDPFSRTPLVFQDHKAAVVRVVAGKSLGDEVTIRTIGGRVGQVDVSMESEASLVEGRTYLLYLRQVDFPMQEGSERSWTVVAGSQGVFSEQGGGEWVSSGGLKVDGS